MIIKIFMFLLPLAAIVNGQRYNLSIEQRLPVLNNPAAFGGNNCRRVAAGCYGSPYSITGAPETKYVMADDDSLKWFGRIGANILILQDNAGLLGYKQVQLNFNTRLFDYGIWKRLRVGLGLRPAWRSIETAKLRLEEAGDPIEQAQTRTVWDVGLGIYFANDLVRSGAALLHIGNPKIDFIPDSKDFTGEGLPHEWTFFLSLFKTRVRPYLGCKYQDSIFSWDLGSDFVFPLPIGDRTYNVFGSGSTYPRINGGLYVRYKEDLNSIAGKIGFQYNQYELNWYYNFPLQHVRDINYGAVEFDVIVHWDKLFRDPVSGRLTGCRGCDGEMRY